ncbi:hypothetical protein F4561_001485 [Lipingzhangella halophila]|uniref:Uncharacterized protein n=1 Tax=Lipingzhangella halophila TaxID=1783352 RepID=A0A7W7RF33_9ACTN|nr:hypothetical protein [Lipingzhangella halophila]
MLVVADQAAVQGQSALGADGVVMHRGGQHHHCYDQAQHLVTATTDLLRRPPNPTMIKPCQLPDARHIFLLINPH